MEKLLEDTIKTVLEKKTQRRIQLVQEKAINCPTDDEALSQHANQVFSEALSITNSLLNQRYQDKNKIYSNYTPEVECISKGKTHKKYEFGCKGKLSEQILLRGDNKWQGKVKQWKVKHFQLG
ncbi:MAG: hypothetical protein ACUZ8H_10710 [Candidatus Anammoxibacter sp.]